MLTHVSSTNDDRVAAKLSNNGVQVNIPNQMAISPADRMIRLYKVELIHLSSINNIQASSQMQCLFLIFTQHSESEAVHVLIRWDAQKDVHMNHSNFLGLTVFWFGAGTKGRVIDSNCREGFFCVPYKNNFVLISGQESFATVGEIRVWWRADFQSGSRVLKKVF